MEYGTKKNGGGPHAVHHHAVHHHAVQRHAVVIKNVNIGGDIIIK